MHDAQANPGVPDFPAARFTVRTEPRANRPGTWNSTAVTVLDRGVPCGSYGRNYPSYAEETFCPFVIGGAYFALYSRDYTATRIMSLPDCTDLGGEAPDTWGFCPTGLWVPTYRLASHDWRREIRDGEVSRTVTERLQTVLWPDEAEEMARVEAIAAEEQASGTPHSAKDFNHAITGWLSEPFGFVCGCVWGDDSSWKIQFLDLADAASGVIRRDERFGYIELPPRMALRDAIGMRHWEPGSSHVDITHTVSFDLKSGRPL